jgi:hypothetical protein
VQFQTNKKKVWMPSFINSMWVGISVNTGWVQSLVNFIFWGFESQAFCNKEADTPPRQTEATFQGCPKRYTTLKTVNNSSGN